MLFLASKSPRRRELLNQLGFDVEVVAVDIDEQPVPGESAADYVTRLAREKARVAGINLAGEAYVIAADTAVVVANRILGKPADLDDALAMLASLSGRWHEVYSAVCVQHGAVADSRVSVSRVQFRALSAADRQRYCATGEPRDKAGAYAIQGKAASFIERLEGSYSGVMGLPLYETAELLTTAGLQPYL